jgi:spermidine/putrescine transport system substrate-binding protein
MCSTEICADQLSLLTWEEYIDPEIVALFEQETGISVVANYFEEDDDRDSIMASSDGAGYDLILVDDSKVHVYQSNGWLQQLSPDKVPNLQHIEYPWSGTTFDTPYVVPYFWGITGIAYRSDLVPEPITSYRQIFKPVPELSKKIVMQNTAQVLIGSALSALGHSINSNEPFHLEAAEQLLLEQRPHVLAYRSLSVTAESELLSGEAYVALSYSGDALALKEENSNIEFIVPEEGGVVWIDYWAVSANSKRKTQAYKFLNFINRTDMALKNAMYTFYASPHKGARQNLPESILKNPIIYPTDESLLKLEIYREMSPKMMKRVTNIYLRVVN